MPAGDLSIGKKIGTSDSSSDETLFGKINTLLNVDNTTEYYLIGDNTANTINFSSKSGTLISSFIQPYGWDESGNLTVLATLNGSVVGFERISDTENSSPNPINVSYYLSYNGSIGTFTESFNTGWESGENFGNEFKSGAFSETQIQGAVKRTGSQALYMKSNAGYAGRYFNLYPGYMLDDYEVWVYVDDFDTDGRIQFFITDVFDTSDTESGIGIRMMESSAAYFQYRLNGGSWVNIDVGAGVPSEDTWYKLRISYTPYSNTVSFYVYNAAETLLYSVTGVSCTPQAIAAVSIQASGGTDVFTFADDMSLSFNGSISTSNIIYLKYETTGTAHKTGGILKVTNSFD